MIIQDIETHADGDQELPVHHTTIILLTTI